MFQYYNNGPYCEVFIKNFCNQENKIMHFMQLQSSE